MVFDVKNRNQLFDEKYCFWETLIEMNTQSLRIDIEKAKRQKLNTKLKKDKHGHAPPAPLLTKLQNDINILSEQLGVIRNIYESEIARIGLTTYRYFSRLHQILIAVVPRIAMPKPEHQDTSQLLYELLHNIEQLRSPSDSSFSTIV